jgi:SnoaL-like domain
MALAEPTTAELAEIRGLAEAYAIAMDTNDLEAFPRLFVPDGALVVRAPGRDKPLGTFRGPGPDGVGLIARLLADLYEATLHHITTHHASLDGDRATGTTYCLAYHVVAGDAGGALETLGVKYEEQLVRTSDGWRFKVRDATRLWSQITPTPRAPLLIDRAAARSRDGR